MGSSVKLVTKDELTTGNYFNADNLIGGENTTIVKDGDVYKINAVAGESTTIESSDESITVTGTATGYDLKVDTGKLIDKNDNEIFGLSAANAGDNITITGSGSTLKINAAATVSYPHITDSDKVTISVNGSSNTFAFTADNISSLNTLIANRESYLTENVADGRYALKTELNYKQDQLTSDNAGNNITITGSGSTLKINAEATASYPHITDSNNVIISVEGASDTFAFTADNISSLNTLVSNSGNYLTQSTADERYAKTADLSNKQDQLTSDNAGDNVTITGSGSALKINATTAQYESGDGISIENNIISIIDNGITSDKIANGSITTDKLSNNSITPEKIKLYPTDVNSAEISYFQNFNVELGINDRENSVLIGRKLIKYVANSGRPAPPVQILSDAISTFDIYYDFYSDNTVKIYGNISFKINKTFNANTSIRIPCLTWFSLNGEQIYISSASVDSYADWRTATSRPYCRHYILSSEIAYPDETGYDDYFALFVYNNSNVNFNTTQGTGAFNSLSIIFDTTTTWKNYHLTN